jgi:hypothetical protein
MATIVAHAFDAFTYGVLVRVNLTSFRPQKVGSDYSSNGTGCNGPR